MDINRSGQEWIRICALDDITPDTGVCALVNGAQVAIFHVMRTGEIFAIGNVDPHSSAAVLSRGLICSLGKMIAVASPIYKQHFDLKTGKCIETPEVTVRTYPARVERGTVFVRG